MCRDDGSIAWRLAGAEGAPALLAEAYGPAKLDVISDSEVKATSGGTGEFGVTLRPELAGTVPILLQFVLEGAERTLLVSGPQSKIYGSSTQGWALLGPDESALIYAAGPDALHLTQITLETCSGGNWRCAKDKDLAPDLASTPADLNGAIALAQWATREADFGFSTVVSNQVVPGSLSAAQMHAQFYRDDIAGGYCGATAVFLARLLRAKGYDAFSMDFGVPESNLTHVTTIVAMSGKYYLLDATFGGYFAKPGTTQPLDILSILDGAQFDYIDFDAVDRDFIVDQKTYKSRRDPRLREFKSCEVQAETDFLVCKNPAFGLEQYLTTFSVSLDSEGLPKDTTTLRELLKQGVTGLGDGDDTDSLRAFAQALQTRSIPFLKTAGSADPNRLLKVD